MPAIHDVLSDLVEFLGPVFGGVGLIFFMGGGEGGGGEGDKSTIAEFLCFLLAFSFGRAGLADFLESESGLFGPFVHN